MKVAADTNVLLRAYVADDKRQAEAAVDLLAKADIVAVSLQALCEFAWVLGRQYETARLDIVAAIRALPPASSPQMSPSTAPLSRQDLQCWRPAAILRTA